MCKNERWSSLCCVRCCVHPREALLGNGWLKGKLPYACANLNSGEMCAHRGKTGSFFKLQSLDFVQPSMPGTRTEYAPVSEYADPDGQYDVPPGPAARQQPMAPVRCSVCSISWVSEGNVCPVCAVSQNPPERSPSQLRQCQVCSRPFEWDGVEWKKTCYTCYRSKTRSCTLCAHGTIPPTAPDWHKTCLDCFLGNKQAKGFTPCPTCPPEKSRHLRRAPGKDQCAECAGKRQRQ